MNRALAFAAILLFTGCDWMRGEEYKTKWVEESRHHYQTLMIKTAEIEELNRKLANLQAENMLLREQLDSNRRPEGK